MEWFWLLMVVVALLVIVFVGLMVFSVIKFPKSKFSEFCNKHIRFIIAVVFIIPCLMFVAINVDTAHNSEPSKRKTKTDEERYEERYQKERKAEYDAIQEAIDEYKYNEYKRNR